MKREPFALRALARFGAMMRPVRRRFTPVGRLALACLAVSAALGVDTERSMAYQTFTFLLALLSLSVLCGAFFRVRFSAGWRLPRFGTAGQPLRCVMTLRNTGGGTLRGASAAPEQESGRDLPETPVPDLPPGAACEVEAGLLPPRRGKLRLSGVRLSRTDPLGLFRSFSRARAGASVLVLPKRYPVPPLSLPGTRRYQQGGVAAASSVGESEEFISMRDYRPGDPLRRIHWRSWAKTGRPIVKEYQDEYFVRHALALDTSCAAGPEFEEAVSVAASFAAGAGAQDSLLDLLFVGSQTYCFTAGRGLGSPESLLEVLACVEPRGDRPFAELAHAVLRRGASISGCLCVLLGFDGERRDFVRRLRASGVPVLALAVAGPLTPAFEEEAGVLRIELGRAVEGLAGI